MTIAITGGSGFLGAFVVKRALLDGRKIRILTRTDSGIPISNDGNISIFQVDYSNIASLRIALEGCSSIVHLAGIAHTTASEDAEPIYRRVIVDYSKNLWCAASENGCSEFTFASTVKVFGDRSHEEPFHETSACSPDGIYGRCKYSAEKVLSDLADSHSMNLRIVRLPPIYGAGARGAVRHLFRCAKAHIPLPVFGFRHRRSFLSAENAAIILMGAAMNRLQHRLYVASEREPWQIGEFYSSIYYAVHGKRMPDSLRWSMPHFCLKGMQHIPALKALAVPFSAISKHQNDLDQLGLLDVEAALKNTANASI